MSDQHVLIENVAKRFEMRKDSVLALSDVSLSLRRGEFVALIGPSGCGKSTLLRLLADITDPSEGLISVGGRSPRDARLAHRIGFVFQDPTLLPWRTVLDNVKLPIKIARGRAEHGSESPEELLDLVGLGGFENAHPAQLSGGMRQRVAIARALALTPELLLLDEPFGALDEISRQHLNLEMLRIWTETGATAVLVTHAISEAVLMADRVVVLSPRPGRVTEIIEVDLPRPRTLDLMQTPEFFRLENAVRSALFGTVGVAEEPARSEAHQ
jgi:NitT/TauT family transport system ATP-binding protein